MFGILELVHIVALAGDQYFNFPSTSDRDITRTPEVKVYSAQMTQRAPIWVNPCRYEGVFVEYARTWEEERNGTVWPAEPDKPAGYGLILTKQNCPDKGAEEAILAVGEQWYGRKYILQKGRAITSYMLTAENQEKIAPKWLPQVMETIKKEAEASNPAAQAFMASMADRMPLPSLPGVSDGTTPTEKTAPSTDAGPALPEKDVAPVPIAEPMGEIAPPATQKMDVPVAGSPVVQPVLEPQP